MTADRGAEIERFYWLILNLLGKAFGYLMAVAGGLFVLGFVSELLRTDEMTWDGQALKTWPEQWPVLLGGTVVFALGILLIRLLPYQPKKLTTESKRFGE